MLFLQAVFTQESPVFFEHLTTEDGLSQNDINCIFQDSKGFMWFGTNDGLNKYNGYKFTIYKPKGWEKTQISSNLIFSIAEDRQQQLWIGTTGQGLNVFNTKKETFSAFKHDPDDPASLCSNYIIKVFVDRQNRLWVATNNGLDLMYLDRPKDGFFHMSLYPDSGSTGTQSPVVNAIFEDRKGNVLIGSNSGAFQIIFPEDARHPGINTAEPILVGPAVRAIEQDKYGRLVLATMTGLYYEGEPGQFTAIANGSHYSVVLDDDYNIWSGSGNGLYFFRSYERGKQPGITEIFRSDPYSASNLSKNNVKTLYKDPYGLIWIGTNGGGVNKINPRRKPFFHYKNTLTPTSIGYDKIRAIFEDSHGTLWMGTEGGGLNMQHSSRRNDLSQNFSVLPQPARIFAITEYQKDDRRLLIVGGESYPALGYLDITDNPATLDAAQMTPIANVSSSIFSFLIDRRNNLWIGSYANGLLKWNGKGDLTNPVFTNYTADPKDSTALPNNIIRNIFEDSKGNIWIGTGDGLSKLSLTEREKDQPAFVTYKFDPADTNSISHNYILALYEDREGHLWIGTFGGGLNQLIPGNGVSKDRFVRYTSEDGLPNDVVKGILEDDDGHLWLATNRGLSSFDPRHGHFTNFDVNDGLQSSEFSELACFRLRDGTMLFGGVKGFNAFNAEDIRINQDIPNVAITELLILNRPVEVGEQINGRVLLPEAIGGLEQVRLKYFENSFSLEFAALHYIAPTKNKYAYKLEGFNRDWIYTDHQKRFATYTNLSPGDYTFELKASNNDGVWSEPIEIGVTIIPPIWRTWYAYLFYTAAALFLLWLFRRYTLIGVAEKHKLMIKHLEKEKAEELHQMKLRFFTNISHELRTPLTLIISPLENLLKQKKEINLEEQRQDFQLMYKNSRYLLRLVNQLLDFRKLDQGKMKLGVQHADIVQFTREITEPFQFLAGKKNIRFEVVVPQNEIRLWFDPDVLEKILYNLLSNAFKFTPENGAVSVVINTLKRNEKGLLKKESPGPHLSLSVVDSGPGVPAKYRKKIFERFYKTPGQAFGNRLGAGIGLAFTKSLVELHHGSIRINSKPDSGTTFKVLLPLDKTAYGKEEFRSSMNGLREFSRHVQQPLSTTEEQFPDPNPEYHEKQLSALTNRKEPLLLIIDDHEDLRAYIHRSFTPDFLVIEAADGLEGLQKTMEYSPDLIISDISMPHINGITLCKQLKADEQTSHIPIILLTAKTSEEAELEGLQTGADAYVKKPFNMDVLKTKVQNILKVRSELQKRFRREVFLEPSEITVTTLDEAFLKQAMKVVEDHMSDTEFTVEEMVKEMAVSRSKLYVKLKALTGQSTSEFIRTIRLKRAVQLFEQSDYSVKEIMYRTGFNTSSYFSKCFKKQFGVLPSEYVKNINSHQ